MATTKKFTHSDIEGREYHGENIANYESSEKRDKTLTKTPYATDTWYSEIKDYDFSKPSFSEAT